MLFSCINKQTLLMFTEYCSGPLILTERSARSQNPRGTGWVIDVNLGQFFFFLAWNYHDLSLLRCYVQKRVD